MRVKPACHLYGFPRSGPHGHGAYGKGAPGPDGKLWRLHQKPMKLFLKLPYRAVRGDYQYPRPVFGPVHKVRLRASFL